MVALAANLLVNQAISGAHVAAGLGLIACLVVIARVEGLSAADLGLRVRLGRLACGGEQLRRCWSGQRMPWGTWSRRCARPSPMVMAAWDARCCGRSWS
jgi:hypothetical protein